MARSEKERVQYSVEERPFSSRVDGMKSEKPTLDCTVSYLQYNYDGAFVKERKASNALKMLRASVKEVHLMTS